ncbi:MAG: hypothetical protein DBY17_05165 [Oscillospiraceae bacterium]|nr:MAG: hypothetical protein DBY17_05165 [Oscillospiraceae bacterium]
MAQESTGFGQCLWRLLHAKTRQAVRLAGLFYPSSSQAAGPKLRAAPQAAAFGAGRASLPQTPFAAGRESGRAVRPNCLPGVLLSRAGAPDGGGLFLCRGVLGKGERRPA